MVKTKSSHVYLDLTHLKKDFVRVRFPRINATCKIYHIDIAEDLIPVSPAAHYMMGGVRTDLNGATNICRLFAAGEVACTGVHGANRLASNSLLEGLVFGARAGIAASHLARQSLDISKMISSPGRRAAADDAPNGCGIKEMRASLRSLMWGKVGIMRSLESLSSAREKLSSWLPCVDDISLQRQEQELRNMATVAHLITDAAIERRGSIGAHYRSDFPGLGENWSRHTLSTKDTALRRV
jgi:L-aspartate oxidase